MKNALFEFLNLLLFDFLLIRHWYTIMIPKLYMQYILLDLFEQFALKKILSHILPIQSTNKCILRLVNTLLIF